MTRRRATMVIQIAAGRWMALRSNPDYAPGDPARCSRWVRVGEAASEAEARALLPPTPEPPKAPP